MREDTLAANAYLYGGKQWDGWGTNLSTGNPTYRNSDFGGRIKLLWTPDQATTVLLTADYDKTKTQEGVV